MCHGQELDYIAIKVRICHGPWHHPGAVFALQTTGMSGVSGMMSIHNGSSMEIPSGKFSRYGKQQKYGRLHWDFDAG